MENTPATSGADSSPKAAAVVNGRATLTKSVSEPGVYSSLFPSEKLRDWNRKVASFRRIDTLKERISKLERDR